MGDGENIKKERLERQRRRWLMLILQYCHCLCACHVPRTRGKVVPVLLHQGLVERVEDQG